MSGQSSVLLLARTIVSGIVALHSRSRSRDRDDGTLEEWRNHASAERRAAARGRVRPHLAGLVSKRTCRGPGRSAGGTVERERVQLVAAGGTHARLARATRRGGRGLRGRVRGSRACDRRTARGVERGPLADEAPRSACVCAGSPVPSAGLAPDPAGLGPLAGALRDAEELTQRERPADEPRRRAHQGDSPARESARTATRPTLRTRRQPLVRPRRARRRR